MSALWNFLKRSKWRFLSYLSLVMVFGALLFPVNDFGDLITSKVYELTGNQVFLQFRKMNLSLVPTLGFKFEEVSVETPQFPPLKSDELSVSPSLMGLLTFNPGVSVSADGLFRGKVHVETHGGEKNKQNVVKQKIQIGAQKVDLGQVIKFLNSPIGLGGSIDLESSQTIDPSFADQPLGDFDLKVAEAKVLPSNLMTPMGPFNIPGLNFQSLEAAGNLKDGTLRIEKMKLGSAKDELSGTLKGQLDMKFETTGGGQVRFIPGAFDFSIEVEVKSSFEQRIGTIWTLLEGFIESYKRASGPGTKSYAFRISGANIMGMQPPKFSPYQ